MIVYTKEEHKEKIAEIIQLMGMDLDPMVAWQLKDDGRVINDVKLNEIKNDTEEFNFKGVNLEGFALDTIFFYSREQNVIFKTVLVNNEGNLITVKIPDVMKVLDDGDKEKMEGMIKAFNEEGKEEVVEQAAGVNESGQIVDSFGFANNHPEPDWLTKTMSEHDANLFNTELSYITLDEEDQLYEGVRATPRAKPPEGKMITVQVENDARPQSTYMLYDLSQGGLSFLVFTKDEFSVGEKVLIKAFDARKFETPIISEVKAIREADEMGIQFKVGCEFLSQ